MSFRRVLLQCLIVLVDSYLCDHIPIIHSVLFLSNLALQMIGCYLISGAPHHIELRSQAFDDPSQKHEHTAKLFSNCFLSAPVYAYVCDSSGNKTPLRTTLNLSWTPSSCGLLLTKRAQKGEAVFESNTMKCGSRSGDQQVKLKVFSSDHKNLTVSLGRIVNLKSLCRL